MKQAELVCSLGLATGLPLPPRLYHTLNLICMYLGLFPPVSTSKLCPHLSHCRKLTVCPFGPKGVHTGGLVNLPKVIISSIILTCSHGSISQQMAPPSSQLPQKNLSLFRQFLFILHSQSDTRTFGYTSQLSLKFVSIPIATVLVQGSSFTWFQVMATSWPPTSPNATPPPPTKLPSKLCTYGHIGELRERDNVYCVDTRCHALCQQLYIHNLIQFHNNPITGVDAKAQRGCICLKSYSWSA